MIQVLGTASHVGKTTLSTALCRILSDSGYRVAPFKSVNMSLNSVVIEGDREISRSVWLQAVASRTVPKPEMNPFLLKPEADGKSQLIVLGKSMGVMSYREYGEFMIRNADRIIRDSLLNLSDDYDVIIAEGAGSTAEINFNGKDFANSWVSSIFRTPAILIGDIDRGGVFASMYGSVKLMEHPETVKWLVINRMRGDMSLLESGVSIIQDKTGKKMIGVIPHEGNIGLPGEDSLDYSSDPGTGKIAVIRYPFMENQSDLDPLNLRKIGYRFVDADDREFLRNADTVILPGSKDVARDLAYIKESGIAEDLKKLAENHVRIMGICGGYQILGEKIVFQDGSEASGLGILKSNTLYLGAKALRRVHGRINKSVSAGIESVSGYEIHYGDVSSREEKHLLDLADSTEGSVSASGNVIGTNVHGLLESDDFLGKVLGIKSDSSSYTAVLENNVQRISRSVRENLDLDPIIRYLEKGIVEN